MDEKEKELRDAICKEAQSWLGTKYHDYAGIKRSGKSQGGVDCAFFPLRVMQGVGLISTAYKPKWYSPQQWLNSPSQTDKMHLRVVDETMLNIVRQLTAREVTEEEILPGDLMLCQVVNSWTHAAIIIEWPSVVLHPVAAGPKCVIASHATKEGFWANCPKRFFSMFKKEEKAT